jgi:hypothetical protein
MLGMDTNEQDKQKLVDCKKGDQFLYELDDVLGD